MRSKLGSKLGIKSGLQWPLVLVAVVFFVLLAVVISWLLLVIGAQDWVHQLVAFLGHMMSDPNGKAILLISFIGATAVAGIEAKKWDIVPALCITDKRKEVIDFSESYITIGATLTTSANNPKGLTTIAAFNRPEVVFAVPAGSWSESVAKEVAPLAQIKGFGQSTSADLIQEVVAGRADAVVLDTPIQTTVALEAFGDKIRIVPGHNKPLDVRACKVGYGYRKGDTKMRDYVDGFVAKMRSSGKLDALITQYMKPDQIKATN